MGIDAEIYVEGPVTRAELLAAEEFVTERDYSIREGFDGRVYIDTSARFYGPGYERGPWPELYGGIQALAGAFPGRQVHYGGDSEDECSPATDEYMAEIWAHWRSSHGRDYFRE